jgi:hypothetical protein
MNVFATDHPLMREPSPALLRFQKRLLRGFLAILIGYPICLLFLGPYSAIIGTGRFDFLPQVTVRGANSDFLSIQFLIISLHAR